MSRDISLLRDRQKITWGDDKKYFEKIIMQQKKNIYVWLTCLISIAALLYASSIIHYRFDLTKDKRFTLSNATIQMLATLDDKVYVDVFLYGELPAGFKKLANSTNELLQSFKEYAPNNIIIHFSNPLQTLVDTTKKKFIDSVYKLGLQPTNIHVQAKPGEDERQRLVLPGALIHYKDRVVAVDLLKGINQSSSSETLNNAEALLEYKFASAIHNITRKTVPLIGYAVGNGEPFGLNVVDALKTLAKNYAVDTINIHQQKIIPFDIDALIITKPTQPFTDADKIKIDQYVMHGGKVLWMIDNLHAEMDSLYKTNKYLAFDRGLNLEDILFKYGVRINTDLVQDIQSDKIPMVVGSLGNRPQTEMLRWPYFPLLQGNANSSITKNLDPVLSIFSNSIDTVSAPAIQKTILLSTSPNGRTISTPAIVSFESLKIADDPNAFTKPNIPVAVLLEGKFNSLFAHQLTTLQQDSLASLMGRPFLTNAAPNKMIVVADGDIMLNFVTESEGPLPMGMNPYTKAQYANTDFLLNSIDYLVSTNNILETRSKSYTLRLLDLTKVDKEASLWQWVNIGLPVLLLLLFGGVYNYTRTKKYKK